MPCNQNNWYFIFGVTVLSAVVRGSVGELRVRPLIGLKEVPCRFRNTHALGGPTPLSMMKRADIHFTSRQMATNFYRPLSRSINYLALVLDWALIKIDLKTLTDENTFGIIMGDKSE